MKFLSLLSILFLACFTYAQPDNDESAEEIAEHDLNEALKHPLEVEMMSLNDQQIVIPDVMDQFTNMNWFEAMNCGLTQIPPSLCRLKKLEILSLANNRIQYLPDNLGDLTALGLLDLTGNQISKLPESFCSLSSMGQLMLDDNQFKELPPCLEQMPELIILSMGENQLEEIPASIGKLKGLGILNLNDNKLTKLPDEIALLHLEYLDLRGNPISAEERKRILKLVPKDCEVLFE